MISLIGGFHMWTIFFGEQSPRAELEKWNPSYLWKASVSPFVFVRNGFHTRLCFPLCVQNSKVLMCLIKVFMTRTCKERNRYWDRKSDISCMWVSVRECLCMCMCVCVWCEKCGRAALRGLYSDSGVSYLHRMSLSVRSAISDESVWKSASFSVSLEQVTSTGSHISLLLWPDRVSQCAARAEESNVISEGHVIRWSPADAGRMMGKTNRLLAQDSEDWENISTDFSSLFKPLLWVLVLMVQYVRIGQLSNPYLKQISVGGGYY